MINKIINGYTIKHLIGSGGMADVYYAENKLGKKAAIKVLKSELCAISSIKERFEQEARIMVDLEHKHIRQAYDLDDVNNQPAIVMEYLEGQTLKQLIDKGKISDEKAKKYFEQCVSALKAAHTKEIVHRDIKPSNIFITRDDEVKILDFGIAKIQESSLGTLTNQMLGTPVYMSPEQIKSPKNVGTKSDVYSLAVTFYHALTGQVPYDSTTDSDFEIQRKIVYEDLDMSRVTPLWGSILMPMLVKDPNQRIDINGIDGKGIFDEATQYDHKPEPKSKQEIKLKPNHPKGIIPKWVYKLIGAVVLALAVIVGMRNCGEKDINIDDHESGPVLVDSMTLTKTEISKNDDQDKNDESAWQEAEISNTKASYERYINEYPKGKYVNDARSKIVEIEKNKNTEASRKQDEAAWHQAKSSNTKASYERYIHDYPNGRYESEARGKIRDIEAAEQKRQEQVTTTKPYIKMISIPGRKFKLSETEVTIGQYLAFCKATNSHWPAWLEKGSEDNIYTGSSNTYKNVGMAETNTFYPITGISAIDANAFCKWMGCRLPTQDEWEYAAKAGNNFEYAGSNNLDEVGWYTRNSGNKVHPVRQKKANGYQLYDMSGNVWEWTSSNIGAQQVISGGCWGSVIGYCRVNINDKQNPQSRLAYLGLRIAIDE